MGETKYMKKLICLFLCACLICTVLPAGVLAAETTATETMLFADDFEDYAAGANITAKTDTYGEWSSAVASSVSTIKAQTVDAVRGKAAHFFAQRYNERRSAFAQGVLF